MNILIVYSHPSEDSYTFRIFKRLKEMLENQNWDVQVSDLYADHFNCILTAEEYLREGMKNPELPIPEDVLDEQKKIERADCVIFIYPVWWSDCPAILKGWFDRVFSVGYAYGHSSQLAKMKTIKYGVVICTAGHSNELLDDTGITQSMKMVMLEDRMGHRFKQKEMFILGGTLEMQNVMEVHLAKLETVHENIVKLC